MMQYKCFKMHPIVEGGIVSWHLKCFLDLHPVVLFVQRERDLFVHPARPEQPEQDELGPGEVEFAMLHWNDLVHILDAGLCEECSIWKLPLPGPALEPAICLHWQHRPSNSSCRCSLVEMEKPTLTIATSCSQVKMTIATSDPVQWSKRCSKRRCVQRFPTQYHL